MDINAPAFPAIVPPKMGGISLNTAPGVSVLTYASIAAMRGLLSYDNGHVCPPSRVNDVEAWRDEMAAQDAKVAVRYAKALLAELARQQPTQEQV